jgi:NMD protein affecting ribosome stability and mRNA decay
VSETNTEFEQGVCVACKAASEIVFDPEGLNVPVCKECKEDGTFTNWLAAELDKACGEMGWSYRIDPSTGHKLWTPPECEGKE